MPAYRLCAPCASRLTGLTLRPVEWYNLMVLHGHRYHLCDEFYEDDGTARVHQVRATLDQKAPTLEAVAGSIEPLLDDCETRWRIDERTEDALRRLDPEGLLASLRIRVAQNPPRSLGTACRICARVLAARASGFVRDVRAPAVAECRLFRWAEAAAACLKPPDGLTATMAALEGLDGRDLERRMIALAWFQAPEVLDWIEAHVPPRSVVDGWGRLAALCCPRWDRLQAWLDAGRPLNLVALDALRNCLSSSHGAPFQRELRYGVRTPPSREALLAALENAARRDPVPHVERLWGIISEEADTLMTVTDA